MTRASDLMKALAEAGAPFEAILIAVQAVEDAEAQIETARALARERKRRQRAKQSDEGVTVTGQSRDMAGTVTADPALSRPPNENNSNPPTHTHPDMDTPCARSDPFPMPAWCPSRQLWADFKSNRKAKRLPCTPTAHAKLLRDIDALTDADWPPGKLFEAIVARGWAAAYDPRERTPANDRNNRPDKSTRSAAQLALQRLHHG